jgi:hypothetical protein
VDEVCDVFRAVFDRYVLHACSTMWEEKGDKNDNEDKDEPVVGDHDKHLSV